MLALEVRSVNLALGAFLDIPLRALGLVLRDASAEDSESYEALEFDVEARLARLPLQCSGSVS